MSATIDLKPFGLRLIQAREALGLRQFDVAQRCNRIFPSLRMTDAAIGKYERGKTNPSTTSLAALSIALEISADYLIAAIPAETLELL